MTRWLNHLGALAALLSIGACATYRPLALDQSAHLADRLSDLDLTSIQSGHQEIQYRPGRPLTPRQIGLVAARNNPGLKNIPGKLGVANSDLMAAQILPNPSATLGYAFLLGGPGTIDAISASISQDVRSIITYKSRVASATARFSQVSVSVVWDVWQVAQKARMLAIDVYGDEEEIKYRLHSLAWLTQETHSVREATQQGNLALSAEAPLIAALATAKKDLATARLQQLKDWQALDALLGLKADVRFAIAAPSSIAVPRDVPSLIASLPDRRPDLIALRLGYDAADDDVRLAILTQIPALNLGLSGGRDTTDVVSLGPSVTFDLPIFDRNQAGISKSRATRLQLHAEYLAALDDSAGTARGLVAQIHLVETNLARARTAVKDAKALLSSAENAYQTGNVDQRSLVDYQSNLLDRELEVVGYQKTLHEDATALEVELGLGLPQPVLTLPNGEEIRS
jgi:outer membrane protein TolC